MARGEVFLDSSYAIALTTPKDAHHAAALRISHVLEAPGSRVVTTRAVMVEIGDALARANYRHTAADLIAHFEIDPNVEVVPLSEDLFHKAFWLFRERSDKQWGLTDCLSFIVMWERGIADALTADHHFRQAGFRPLLESSQP